MNHEVSNALRCLPANDICLLGARDWNSSVREASVESCSVHVRQTGSVRVQLSSCSTNSFRFTPSHTYATMCRAPAPVHRLARTTQHHDAIGRQLTSARSPSFERQDTSI